MVTQSTHTVLEKTIRMIDPWKHFFFLKNLAFFVRLLAEWQ